MRLDGYIRVSRVNGRAGETFISPELQREKIAAYAKTGGHRIISWHTDLDQSGAKADRPGLQAALVRVESGATDGIAVAKLNRFGRSVVDATTAIRRIDAAGGTFVSAEDSFDTSTPTGKCFMTILFAFAEMELDQIRLGWKESQRKAVERGVHVASKAPTGYRRRDDGRLELDKRASRAIAEVFRRRAAGASWSELGAYLEKRRVVGPYGSEHWTASAVARVIGNRAYLGEARSGQFTKADAHPAIVSEAEWLAAQSSHAVTPLRTKNGALLAGILRCAGCRYAMKPDTMRDRDGETIRNYRCRGKHAAGRCPRPASVLGRVIEPWVEQQFLAALGPAGLLARSEPATKDVEEAHRRAEEARLELETWASEPRARAIGSAYWTGLEARHAALEEAQAALVEEDVVLDELPQDVLELWPTLTVAERRRLLALGIDAVMMRRGKILAHRTHILWRGQAEPDFPTRGRRVPLASFPWPHE